MNRFVFFGLLLVTSLATVRAAERDASSEELSVGDEGMIRGTPSH